MHYTDHRHLKHWGKLWLLHFQGQFPEKLSADPLFRWLRSEWQSRRELGGLDKQVFHNCYVCQPRDNFGLRKPKSVTESFDILIGGSTSRRQTVDSALNLQWSFLIQIKWRIDFIDFWIYKISKIFWIGKRRLYYVPRKNLLIDSLEHGGRELTWQGWNFFGMQGWLLFRLKIGDFAAPGILRGGSH